MTLGFRAIETIGTAPATRPPHARHRLNAARCDSSRRASEAAGIYDLLLYSDSVRRFLRRSGKCVSRNWMSARSSTEWEPLARDPVAPPPSVLVGTCIVSPFSTYRSITTGCTYAFRQIAGVLPSSAATRRIVVATFSTASRFDFEGPRSASTVAARSVPPQVRKSFALYGKSATSWRY